MLLVVVGCEPSWRSQFKDGAKLYDKNDHRYFGKVVGYEASHDFANREKAGSRRVPGDRAAPVRRRST